MFEITSRITHQPQFTTDEIISLNATYKALTARERIRKLYLDFELSDVMLTSSFAVTSAFLLKLVSDVNKNQEVFFIDTGYHFHDKRIPIYEHLQISKKTYINQI